jgi:acyl carrier protein
MSNSDRYDAIFLETFSVKHDELISLQYLGTSYWDSVGHMALIAAIEDAYNVVLVTEDLNNFRSYAVGKEILKKYGVEI